MEFSDQEKKNIILSIVVIAISILLGIVNTFISSGNKPNKFAKELGEKYYINTLYKSLSRNNSYVLSLFEKDGYKVYLKSLIDGQEKYLSMFVNDKTKCDLENSYIVIYQTKPHREKDYKIKTNLDCE